jgi:hypothetical protein
MSTAIDLLFTTSLVTAPVGQIWILPPHVDLFTTRAHATGPPATDFTAKSMPLP